MTIESANLPFTDKVRVAGKNGGSPAVQKPFLKMISGPPVLRSAVNGCTPRSRPRRR